MFAVLNRLQPQQLRTLGHMHSAGAQLIALALLVAASVNGCEALRSIRSFFAAMLLATLSIQARTSCDQWLSMLSSLQLVVAASFIVIADFK